jgi:pimeloyl-ACP methyl ester carboxylesterase
LSTLYFSLHASSKEQGMNTLFTVSPDGTQISYDRSGEGPAILLLHGGGGKRQDWHETGYVARLKEQFTVITIDLRGHGESGLPTDPAEYTTDKMGLDILAVADACGFEHFILWGMSFGGKIGRYLAVQSERVTKFIMMGTPMVRAWRVNGARRMKIITRIGLLW